MAKEKELHYFKNPTEWRNWLLQNHNRSLGIELLFYKIDSANESMRWEEAVQVVLCFGWIDSTVRKVCEESRKQAFCPRKDKSVWSKLNKSYIAQLIDQNLMHESGLKKIEIAKQNNSWEALDAVENLEIPADLQMAFNVKEEAFKNYQNFSPSYRKNYLYWLNQAKRPQTRAQRIAEIITLCDKNCKSR